MAEMQEQIELTQSFTPCYIGSRSGFYEGMFSIFIILLRLNHKRFEVVRELNLHFEDVAYLR